MNFILKTFILVLLILTDTTLETAYAVQQQKIKYLKDYKRPDFIVSEVNLTINLDDQEAVVINKMKIKRANYAGKNVPLILDGRNQVLVDVAINGKSLDPSLYKLTDISLTIPTLKKHFEVTVISKNKPQENTLLKGLFKSDDIYLTQCEPHGFQNITYYIDRPDIMPVFTTKLIADKKYPVLLSNGTRIKQGTLPNNKHYAVWHDHTKKPSYLFAAVFGNLAVRKDKFITKSGKTVNLELYSPDKDIDKTQTAMDALKAAMKWDEDVFDREYDLKTYMIVGASKFNSGAMENKGLNIFNNALLLANKEVATDWNYKDIYDTISHEYFHNWTGNRITLRDWFQLSLKEGLTVFRHQEFSCDMFSRTVGRINDADLIKNIQFREDSGPLAHPVRPDHYSEIRNFYTTTIYRKGAEVVRVLRVILGDKKFFKGMDLYFKKYDGHAITCDNFIEAFEEANGIDLTQFRLWYSQAGTPALDIKDSYDAKKQIYILKIKQTVPDTPGQKNKKPMHIPVKLGLIDKKTGLSLDFKYKSVLTKEVVLNVKKPYEEFILTNVVEKPIPSLLRDFSAPVKLNYSYTEEDLLQLLENDENEFNRYNAGQKYAKGLMLKLSQAISKKKPLIVPHQYINAIRSLLKKHNWMDNHLLATSIILPREKTIYTAVEEINPENIHQARKFIIKTIGKELKKDFLDLYKKLNTNESYKFSYKDSGKRFLKNISLSYIFEGDNKLGTKLAEKQLEKADNLTDRLSALHKLINSEDEIIHRNASDRFYNKWHDEELIVNKWLSLHGSSEKYGTVKKVKSLMKHESFDLTTPNKVYYLMGSFVGNTSHFHALDGSGYNFVKNMILELDKINPQVAANFIRVFASWKKFEPRRKKLIQHVLRDIQSNSKLSSNSRELVTSILK